MAVYKDEKTNTWMVYYRVTDWKGDRKQSTKRGFQTKRDALAWEREFLNKTQADLSMTFASFVDTYTVDMKNRIKENTWHTKEHIIRTKILPYFGKRKISDIQPRDIIAWQNEMIKGRDKNGKKYSPVYLKTLHNQLSAIFNHAVKFYGLKENPAAKVGNMGKARSREMLFWTQEEYQKFAFAIMDKPVSYYAFEMLYWCGIREGELLALTAGDFDFERGTRKQNADDKFDMISGTTALLGAADGGFILQKEKRTSNNATLEVSGRDQPDQKLHLVRNTETLLWELERVETELWKEPPEPLLEKVAAFITADNAEWCGSPTELVMVLGIDMKANALSMKLNINAGRLFNEYGICYENKRCHDGRKVRLYLE